MTMYLAYLNELGTDVTYLCNRLSKIPSADSIDGCNLKGESGEIIAMLVHPEMFLAFSNLVAGMIAEKTDPVDVLSRQLDRFTRARGDQAAPDNGSGMTDVRVTEYLKGHIETALARLAMPIERLD